MCGVRYPCYEDELNITDLATSCNICDETFGTHCEGIYHLYECMTGCRLCVHVVLISVSYVEHIEMFHF